MQSTHPLLASCLRFLSFSFFLPSSWSDLPTPSPLTASPTLYAAAAQTPPRTRTPPAAAAPPPPASAPSTPAPAPSPAQLDTRRRSQAGTRRCTAPPAAARGRGQTRPSPPPFPPKGRGRRPCARGRAGKPHKLPRAEGRGTGAGNHVVRCGLWGGLCLRLCFPLPRRRRRHRPFAHVVDGQARPAAVVAVAVVFCRCGDKREMVWRKPL